MITATVMFLAAFALLVMYIIFTGKDDGDDDYTPSGAL